jgi:arginine decarboxylase-like protein
LRINFFTNASVDLFLPSPGPIIKTSILLSKVRNFVNAAKLRVPSLVSGKGRVIISLGLTLINAVLILFGMPKVTNPAPDRKAASAQSSAAPEYLLEPARINMCP